MDKLLFKMELGKNSTLEIEATDLLLDKISEIYNVERCNIAASHVKRFMISALETAIEKSEKETL
jgi:hypothetical protein